MVINSAERKPEVITLSNGIRVVFDVDKGHPTAAVGALIASGSRFEDEHTRGLSHFMEHILFKGTEHRSSLEISSAIENVGGELNAFTDTQYTMFYMRVPRIQTSLALESTHLRTVPMTSSRMSFLRGSTEATLLRRIRWEP